MTSEEQRLVRMLGHLNVYLDSQTVRFLSFSHPATGKIWTIPRNLTAAELAGWYERIRSDRGAN